MNLGKYELNRIYQGDSKLMSLDIPDNSVDLIFCDPPYLKEDVESGIYEWLSMTASRVLKPGALCCAYAGKMYLPEVLSQMETHLEYYWLSTIYLPQGASVWSKKLWSNHRPIAMYSKGDHNSDKRYWIRDATKSTKREKTHHQWQQDIVGIEYYIYSLTQPGDIVFDPFCGSGTVPLSCAMNGCNYLAFEIEQKHIVEAHKRLKVIQRPLFVSRKLAEEPIQTSLGFPDETT